MSYKYDSEFLSAMADAIREKTGESSTSSPKTWASKIKNIQTIYESGYIDAELYVQELPFMWTPESEDCKGVKKVFVMVPGEGDTRQFLSTYKLTKLSQDMEQDLFEQGYQGANTVKVNIASNPCVAQNVITANGSYSPEMFDLDATAISQFTVRITNTEIIGKNIVITKNGTYTTKDFGYESDSKFYSFTADVDVTEGYSKAETMSF